MKIDNVVVSGCSFTWGDELVDREERFVSRIARHYGAKLYDYSKNGSSNELISTRLINNTSSLLANGSITPDNTMVVVQWTLRERLHYYSQSGKYYPVNHGMTDSTFIKQAKNNGFSRLIDDSYVDNMDLKLFFENHAQIPYLTYNFVSKIHHAQMFLQNKRLKYIFVFANKYELKTLQISKEELELLRNYGSPDPKYTLPDISSLVSEIDMTKVYKKPFLVMSREGNFPTALGNHPREEAHIEYSNRLIDFMEKTYD